MSFSEFKRLSFGIEQRHPVTNCKALRMGLSTKRVCLLQHQTGAQYSAAEWNKRRVAISNILASEPHWNLLIISKVQHKLLAFYSMILDIDGL